MKNSILLGIRRLIIRIPKPIWQYEVQRAAEGADKSLAFMTSEHHKIRDYVVRQMPRISEPIPPERIASDLNLPLDTVVPILDELEKNMTFLYRDEHGAVIWAYPVTVTKTPHRIKFSSGETIYAA